MRLAHCILTALVAVGISRAHVDPDGDVHPLVCVEDGGFAVYFEGMEDRRRSSSPEEGWRMTFTPDGRLVLPRHRVPEEQKVAWRARLFAETKWSVRALAMDRQNNARRVLLERTNGTEKRFPLPLEPGSELFRVAACRAGDEVGFAWSNRREAEEKLMLKFSAVSLGGFAPGVTVEIGEPAAIYDSPCVSNPVWASKKWWIAWVRKKKGNGAEKVEWETVLTSIEPLTGKKQDEVLPGLSHWNTGLSLKTTGGWLCAAWHASEDGSYPGRARIVTAFKKLPE